MLCTSVMIPIYYCVILVLFSFIGAGGGGCSEASPEWLLVLLLLSYLCCFIALQFLV